MAQNDIKVRLKKAEKFLKTGDKVKLVVKFTGRQISKKDFGDKVMSYALQELSSISELIQEPKLIGKLLIAQVKTKKTNKKIKCLKENKKPDKSLPKDLRSLPLAKLCVVPLACAIFVAKKSSKNIRKYHHYVEVKGKMAKKIKAMLHN